MKTPDLQPPGPSASLVETDEAPETAEEHVDASEPAAEDVHIEYSCDLLCNPSIGAVTK